MNVELITKADLLALKEEILSEIRSLNAAKAKQSEFYKSADVRRILRCSHATLQNLRISGALHPVKVGGSWYYSASEVSSLLQKVEGYA